MRWILLSLISINLISCSLFDRSNMDLFSNINDTSLKSWYPMKDKDYVESLLELGYDNPESLSESQQARVNTKMKLKFQERQLQSSAEKEQYYKYQSLMTSDRARLEFLKLNSYQEREAWIQRNSLSNINYSSEVQAAIENNDIVIGMPKQAVIESWGEPDSKDIAGDPVYGNERWKYIQYSSTPEGYILEERYIYFENSRIRSWRTMASN